MIKSKLQDTNFMSKRQIEYICRLESFFQNGKDSTMEKLENFSKYTSRSTIARFLVKYELFKKVLDVQGSVVECGVHLGGGTMTWAQVSAILEPSNHQRRVIGFDTFSGFPRIHDKDRSRNTSSLAKKEGVGADSFMDLTEGIEIFNMTRYMNHIEKVELVKGDMLETVPAYIKENPHLVISLLYLDVDIYEPTVTALTHFLKLMPKGAIIAFDELAQPLWPGETQAVVDTFGLESFRLKRFSFGTSISYAVKE